MYVNMKLATYIATGNKASVVDHYILTVNTQLGIRNISDHYVVNSVLLSY